MRTIGHLECAQILEALLVNLDLKKKIEKREGVVAAEYTLKNAGESNTHLGQQGFCHILMPTQRARVQNLDLRS